MHFIKCIRYPFRHLGNKKISISPSFFSSSPASPLQRSRVRTASVARTASRHGGKTGPEAARRGPAPGCLPSSPGDLAWGLACSVENISPEDSMPPSSAAWGCLGRPRTGQRCTPKGWHPPCSQQSRRGPTPPSTAMPSGSLWPEARHALLALRRDGGKRPGLVANLSRA